MTYPEGFLDRDERFPALHELLDSYTYTGNSFTDTPEKAGMALQAYVRQTMLTTGSLDGVVAEIDDLLQVGLFSDEIADDVDLLPHINPPVGHTVEECLAVIRDHLVRIMNGGAYDQPRLPQTEWEWVKQFPETSMLLGARFNQEFPRFYGSHREALEDHLSLNDHDSLAELARELRVLLSLIDSDRELGQVAKVLGLMVDPPEGLSLHQWLIDIEGTITHHLHTHP